MECNQEVRFNEPARLQYATAAAVVFLDFLTAHYFPQLPQKYCNSLSSGQTGFSGSLVYPNPFNDDLTFQSLFPCELVIYDSLGKMICSKSIGSFDKIELGYLQRGIYMIHFRINNRIIHKEKIIKQ
jgi:hypothetical protein